MQFISIDSSALCLLQAFVILDPMREMQMMNIDSYLGLTIWLGLYTVMTAATLELHCKKNL